jgi:hypothetical protein
MGGPRPAPPNARRPGRDCSSCMVMRKTKAFLLTVSDYLLIFLPSREDTLPGADTDTPPLEPMSENFTS